MGKALKEKHEKKVEKTKKAEAEKKKAAKKEKSMKEKHTKKVKAEKAKKEKKKKAETAKAEKAKKKKEAEKEKATKKKAAEKKEKAKPYKTIRSDGSSPTKPACSWNSKCKWNAESKDKCATKICQLNGYKNGKPVKGSWGSEAFFEVGCGTNHPGVTIKTDGSQKKPYCSWNSKCKWNAAAKAACAKKMCQLNGFKKGKFIWASNNMCKVSATSKSVWNLSWDKPGKPVKGSWGSEAAIEAKCS